MKRILRTRVLPLLLSALLLSSSGCIRLERLDGTPGTEKPETTDSADPTPAIGTEPISEPEPGPEPEPAAPFVPDGEILSEALAMTLVGWGTEHLNDPDGLWSAVGYYAAMTARRTGPDEAAWIPETAAETICSLLRPGENPLPRPDWLGKDGAKAEEKNGTNGFRFDDYAKMLDDTLGVWRALSVEQEDGTWIVSVEDHLDEGVRRCLLYAAFENPPDAGENTVPPLVYLMLTDFTWDEPEGGNTAENNAEDLARQLTWEHLTAANLVGNLVMTYGGFHVRETSYYETPGNVTSDSYYLVDDPGILSVTEGHAYDDAMTPYTYTNYSFWDGENILYASAEGKGVSASFALGDSTPAGTYPGDIEFFYHFYNAPAEILETSGNTVTFRTAPEILEGGTLVYTVLADSLAVVSFERYSADGTLTYSRTAEYGRDKAEDFTAPSRKDVSNQRIIRLKGTWYSETGFEELDYFLHVPKNWELTLIAWGDLFLYANEGFTGAVDNPIEPGEEDLTLWVTNAAG